MRWLRALPRRPGLMGLVLAALLVLPIYAAPTLWLPGPTYRYLFVLDVTQSMNVRDVDDGGPARSRLDAAREALIGALRALPCGSHASVALFADSETLPLFEPLEVCAHFPAMEQIVAGLDWRMAWSGNSQIDVGFASALAEAALREMDLVFVTDGDQKPERRAVRLTALHALRGKARGWLVGIGGDQARPVPRLDAHNRIAGYWEPGEARRQGFNPNAVAQSDGLSAGYDSAPDSLPDEHLSALHEPELEDLARAAGLGYLRLTGTNSLLRAVNDPGLARMSDAPRDLRAVFGLFAGVLLLVGWMWRERST